MSQNVPYKPKGREQLWHDDAGLKMSLSNPRGENRCNTLHDAKFLKCPIRIQGERIDVIHCMTQIFKMSNSIPRAENRCNTLRYLKRPIWIQGERIDVIHCMTRIFKMFHLNPRRENIYIKHCTTQVFNMSHPNPRRENICKTLHDADFKNARLESKEKE